MTAFSVIVTAHNNAGVIRRTLASVAEAIAYHHADTVGARPDGGEVVVVDDGSTDGTSEAIRDFTQGNPFYLLVRRDRPSSPSCARNTGAAASSGDLLFFLDGDDLFLPEHVHRCCAALEDPAACFVKTGVRLADPVHPDWRARIEHSVVINLCLRRWCHFAVGGFPDYQLCVRYGDRLRPTADIFYKIEDQYYSELVCSLFPGLRLAVETVEHLRYPGNTFDRQYEKFRRPFGEYREAQAPEYRFRLRLAGVILEHHRAAVRERLALQSPGSR
jgi:glycosyltransferase involved in cell wall biosynthesis